MGSVAPRLRAPERAATDSGNRRTRKVTPVPSLFEEFPWLQDHFAARKRAVPRRPGSVLLVDADHETSDSDGDGPVPHALVDAAIDEQDADAPEEAVVVGHSVASALKDIRDQIVLDDRQGSFYVTWLGGEWTEAHTGEAFDRIVVHVSKKARPLEFVRQVQLEQIQELCKTQI